MNKRTISFVLFVLISFSWLAALSSSAMAHHVLGRPSYALNEDSNTPSSMQVETQIGDYFVNYMVFPAFPRPNESGRVNLYVRKLDGGPAYSGKVDFLVRDNSWSSWLGLGDNSENLGAQVIDDNVYRQGFVFRQRGSYIITAHFMDGETPYDIDFPLQVGAPSPVGPIGIAVVLILTVLGGVSLAQRRRAMSGQTRSAHAEGHD
ncbi:MAG: hypothetical protein GY927_09645 [bacterium]|nr:hypothetical protein [bacterium]